MSESKKLPEWAKQIEKDEAAKARLIERAEPREMPDGLKPAKPIVITKSLPGTPEWAKAQARLAIETTPPAKSLTAPDNAYTKALRSGEWSLLLNNEGDDLLCYDELAEHSPETLEQLRDRVLEEGESPKR